MTRVKVFKSNKSQAIRLPKDVALPEHVKSVDITKLGDSRLISPAGGSWQSFFEGPRATDDFMAERNQPPPQRRDGI